MGHISIRLVGLEQCRRRELREAYDVSQKRRIAMGNNWITPVEAVAMVSKNSHHLVSPHHIHTLINRGKIGTRSSPGDKILLKRSDVAATRVAVGTGNRSRRERD